MGEDMEPVAGDGVGPGNVSNRRLLIEMMAVTAVTGVIGFIAGSGRFLGGVLIGGAISIVNFLWLERSLGSVFRAAVEGVKPGLLAARYFLRYVLIGLVLFGVYMTGAVPMVAVILGLASFAFAVVIDGIISIFRNP